MGFRFYWHVSVVPGLRLNFSKSSGTSYGMISTKRCRGNKQGSALVGFIILVIICVSVWKLL
jgi:hypothetical protein